MLHLFLPVFFLVYIAVLLRVSPGVLNRGTPSLADWKVEWTRTGPSFTTRGFNELAARVTGCSPGARRVFRKVYSAATAVGVFGTVLASLTVVVGAISGWQTVWSLRDGIKSAVLIRRSFPLIPGLNAPWSHLLTLLLGLIVAELVHEGGHGLAASSDEIRPSAFVIKWRGILPSMALTFPSTTDDLPRPSRLRVVSGGALHSLLLYLLLLTANRAYPSTEGRKIVAIDSKSGLDRKLHVGDTVTHLNGVDIGNKDMKALVYAQDAPETGGWCVASSLYHSAPSAPCDKSLVTFVQVHELGIAEEENHCLQAQGIITSLSGYCACAPDEICIRPARDERIMRVRYIRNGFPRVFIWKGEKTVMLGLTLSTPRSGIMVWVALFFMYAKTASLAVLLFPLLPLPGLETDGTKILGMMLSSSSGHTSALDYELEAGERKTYAQTQADRAKDVRARRIQAWVSRGVAASLVAIGVAAVVLWWS